MKDKIYKIVYNLFHYCYHYWNYIGSKDTIFGERFYFKCNKCNKTRSTFTLE
jgi:hypothetical protein